MRNFAHISKIMPLAILLAFGLVVQSLVLSQHGRANVISSSSVYNAIIICADGELQEIVIDEDGNPIDKFPLIPPCAFCLAAERIVLDMLPDTVSLYASFGRHDIQPVSIIYPELLNAPEQPNCLDPPHFA